MSKINFYNKWTHANTKLGAPLLFCEICEEDENGEIICAETNGIEGAKNFFARVQKLIKYGMEP